MPMQYMAIFTAVKNDKFQMKIFDILVFTQNIDCRYLLELSRDCMNTIVHPHQGGSNEYLQSILEQK